MATAHGETSINDANARDPFNNNSYGTLVDKEFIPVDLPVLVAGGGFSHGQHIAHEGEHNAPLCDLFVTLLQNVGVETDQFSQSKSTLTWG